MTASSFYPLLNRSAWGLLALVFFAAANPALASTWAADASLDVMGFHYKEFADDNSVLDSEDGYIPGVVATLRYDDSTWGVVSTMSFHSGDVTYDGQTQFGRPITTTTSERMRGITLHSYRRLLLGGPRGTYLYAGVGYQTWEREIQPTRTSSGTFVSGLNEEYRWWTAFLGGQFSLTSGPLSRWDIDTRILRAVNPTVEVDFPGSTRDNTELPLGEAWGLRVSAPWEYAWDPRAYLRIEPYFAAWEFGRSASKPLKQGGVVIGSVREPRSETRVYGITVGVGYTY